MEKPIVQALLVADHAWRGQGKGHLIGIFHEIWVRSFPSSYSQECIVYASLTNAAGSVPLEIRFVKLDTDEIIMRINPPFTMSDPLQHHDFVIEIPANTIPLPEPGQYAFELVVEGETLGRFRVGVGERTGAGS